MRDRRRTNHGPPTRAAPINKEEKTEERGGEKRPKDPKREREKERPEEREKNRNKPRRRKPKQNQNRTENRQPLRTKKPKEKGGRRIVRHCWKRQQRHPEPPSTSHATVAPSANHRLQPRQVRSLPCIFFFLSSSANFRLLHADLFCMQGTGGKLIPPVIFYLLGQTGSGPEACIWARRVLAQPGGLGRVRPRPSFFLGPRPAQSRLGSRSAQSLVGLSPA